ncbi:ribulose-phosphate 3-epimerase [Verrucomicrobiota bacterium]
MAKIQIMPSMLAADFGRLAEGAKRCEDAGSDQLHMDIMDARFVRNLSFGPAVVAMGAKETALPQHVHLMMMEPQHYIGNFADAGSTTILIHVEADCDVRAVLADIRGRGLRCGVTLNPETPVDVIFPLLDEKLVDEVLLMSVHPGFGGQSYIEAVEEKAAQIRRHADWVDISIDGGINNETVLGAAAHGVNMFVAGSYLFKLDDMQAGVADLRAKAESVYCSKV